MLNIMEDITTVDELQGKLKSVVERVQAEGGPVIITADGKPAVVLISAEEYQQMVDWLADEPSPEELIRLADEAEAGPLLTLDELEQALDEQRYLARQQKAA